MKQPMTPASFLFTTWEGGGSVSPVVAAAATLVRRGHRVRIMSDACNRAEAEAIGAAFVTWTRAPSRPDRTRESEIMRDWSATTPEEGIRNVIDGIICGPALGYAQDVIAELSREPADLVVGLEMLPGVFTGCEAIGQKTAMFAAQISLFPLAGVPPLGPGLAPAKTAEERAAQAEIAKRVEALFDTGLPALNYARAAFGLSPLAHVYEQLLYAEQHFLGTARAFDFAPDSLPAHVSYVGPQLGPVAWASAWTAPWPQDDARPQIAVSFSTTFQNHVGVLQRTIDAIARLPVRGVVTLGGVIDRRELAAAPNVALLNAAPHEQLFAESALVVSHGGHGTVMRALVAQKPMLVIPHGRDQNDNAARVVERGAGLRLDPSATTDEIERALRNLLGDPSYAKAAEALGARVAEEAANSPLAEALESIAWQNRTSAAA